MFQSCAKNPWVPLDGTPIYGVRPVEESRAAAPSEPVGQSYADSPVEPSIYAPTVKGVVEISQTDVANNEFVAPAQTDPSAEQAYILSAPVQDTLVAGQVEDVRPAEPEIQTADQQDQTVSYFIPAPTTIPEVGQEDSLLLSQPAEPTSAPFIPGPAQQEPSFFTAQQEPSYVTAPPSESISYSTFTADQPALAAAEPVQVPSGVQEQIQEQQASILSNFDEPAPTVAATPEEGPQQVAVFFSAPAKQAVSTPTFEYLPPDRSA